MAKNIRFSIVIPVLRINYYLIYENLPAFESQTLREFEVIVVPNDHSPYDQTLLMQYPWLRIVPSGKITRPAQKRDIGVKHATGAIIGFIDDDAYPSHDWLAQSAKLFDRGNSKLAAVSGPGTLPKNSTFWERVFDEVVRTWIGSGGYTYRFQPKKMRYVDDFPSMNFFIKKDVFLRLNGFNSEYWPGEDSKLCNDIVYLLKMKILYDPHVLVHHHRRKDLSGYLRQHRQYGFHRGAFFAHGDKNSKRLSYLIPSIFFIYCLVFFASLISSPIIHYTGSSYAILNMCFSIPFWIYLVFCVHLFLKAILHTKNVWIAACSPAVLILTHLSYGAMFMRGYFTALWKKDRIYD